jgi:segregation and condensation protein A
VPYQVKLEIFEGPLDLLLHLIGRKEIDIYDISIAEISDEYLRYIETLHELDLEVATEFLLIAATLLKLKSDSLLPAPQKEGEEVTPAEMREELLWRLLEYQKFRNAGTYLMERLQREEVYFYRQLDMEDPFRNIVPDVLKGLTLQKLVAAARELVEAEREVDISYIAPIKVNISDYMDRIRAVLQETKRTSYRELTRDCSLRVEQIVIFLALLELYKREEIDIRQTTRFGDIQVYALGEENNGD